MSVDLRVCELLGSRLCHDLISPIGAVTTVVLYTYQVTGPVWELIFWLDEIQVAATSLARIVGVRLVEQDRTEGDAVPQDEHIRARGLRYAYREGSYTGVMEGEIVARVPGERLTCSYRDKLLAVTVDFRMTRIATGTRLTHAIEIVPQTLLARLMAPIIRGHLPGQTTVALERLKSAIEAETA